MPSSTQIGHPLFTSSPFVTPVKPTTTTTATAAAAAFSNNNEHLSRIQGDGLDAVDAAADLDSTNE